MGSINTGSFEKQRIFSGWDLERRAETFKCENSVSITCVEDKWTHEPRNAGDIKELREAPEQQSAGNRDRSPITTGIGFCHQSKRKEGICFSRAFGRDARVANVFKLAMEYMKQRNHLHSPEWIGEQ